MKVSFDIIPGKGTALYFKQPSPDGDVANVRRAAFLVGESASLEELADVLTAVVADIKRQSGPYYREGSAAFAAIPG